MKATLMLEDGKSFNGITMGSASTERIGEVIFNTAVVGYQEMLTDPANAGKILIFTYPLIGNYGCAPKFDQSKKVWAEAAVLKEKSRIYSNWQAEQSFDDFVKKHSLLVLTEVDTRSLAVHLRQKGQMLGIISANSTQPKELLKALEEFRRQPQKSFLPETSTHKIVAHGSPKQKQKKIAVLDLGITSGMLKQLYLAGFHVTQLPYNTSAKDILELKTHGLIISSGPEQDPGLTVVSDNIKALIGRLPILGISSGHQVLAAALGAKIEKMRLGHRGVNCPVHNPASYKGEITVQNHGYAVDADSLGRIKDVKITGYNLNDRTVEEMESKKLKILGVQYEPVCPGFEEVNPVFLKFKKLLERSN